MSTNKKRAKKQSKTKAFLACYWEYGTELTLHAEIPGEYVTRKIKSLVKVQLNFESISSLGYFKVYLLNDWYDLP